MRHAFAHAAPKQRAVAIAMNKTIFEQETAEAAYQQWGAGRRFPAREVPYACQHDGRIRWGRARLHVPPPRTLDAD